MPPVTQEKEIPTSAGMETASETASRARQMLEPSVTADQLEQGASRVDVPEPVVPGEVQTPAAVRGVANQTQQFIQAQSEEANRLRELRQEQASLAGEGSLQDLFTDQQEEFGVPSNLRELQDIQLQLNDMDTESGVTQTRIEGAAGQTLGQAQREVTQEQRENAVRSAGLAARAAVLQGNIQTGSQLASQAVQLAYQDRQLRNQNMINQINSLQGVVDNQTGQLLEQEKRLYEEDQAEIQRVQAAIDTALTSGVTNTEEMAVLTSDTPRLPGESEEQYKQRAKAADKEKYNTALNIVARQAQQDYNLERSIKSRQYEKLGLEIDSINQKAAEAAEAAQSGTLTPEQYEVANDLRSEVNNMPEVKGAKDLEANTASLISALEQENGVGDISAINSFQRLVVDPGVAVREGDVDLLQSAQSFTDEATLAAKGLWKGDKLTPQAREQMKSLVEDVYRIRVELVDRNTSQVRTVANEQGIDYGKYIGNTFQTFDQLRAKATEAEDVEFGITATSEEYLDSAVNALSQDPAANPFGINLE